MISYYSLRFIRISHDIVGFLWFRWISADFLRFHGISEDFFGFLKISHDFLRFLKIFCFKISWDFLRLTRLSLDVLGFPWIFKIS